MPLARNAIIATVAHSQFKRRWVPAAERQSVRAAFVQSVRSNTESVVTAVSSVHVINDVSYDYNETPSDPSVSNI